MEDFEIIHKERKNRIYLKKENYKARLKYKRKKDNVLEIYKTEVPPELRGQGIGNILMREALNYALKNNCKVKAVCSFAQKYIEKHPEYTSLLPSE